MNTENLKKPKESRYSVSDHLELHKTLLTVCNKYSYLIQDPDMINIYGNKLEQEYFGYKWVRRSQSTENKRQINRRRQELLTGIRSIVRANLKNFDPEFRNNAMHVYNLLQNGNNITRVGYDSETAIIDSIIVRLRSQEYIQAAINLRLISWIDELDAQNNLFKDCVKETMYEKIKKPSISAKQSRAETNIALRNIMNRIAALMNINDHSVYVPFVIEFNVVVSHYNTLVNEHYGRLHAKIDIAQARIEAIGVRNFTGKPINVIPAVYITTTVKDNTETTVELVFSQDFNLSYANNINPGTATLTIHGIGKYAGELVTTFNIAQV
jgi:hypothetical protein